MTAAPVPETRYRRLESAQAADALERELLARWKDEDLFRRSLAARAEGEPWIFFEGPPTANGRPGIHHVFARTIKDLFCRHRAMRGHMVPRKAGWDTHGLPVEIEVEKQLGISGKPDIERIGVERFNQLCRESVWKYRADWEKLSERIAYWLDYDDAYVTYSSEYVESVWWALATLHERGLLFRGHKILPYCSRCGTALSSHEVALGYEDVSDPSLFVALELESDAGVPRHRTDDPAATKDAAGRSPAGPSTDQLTADDRRPTTSPSGSFTQPSGRSTSPSGSATSRPAPGGRRILVWTTTPWTLVSNVALAVHPALEYVELRRRDAKDARTLILAAARVPAVLGEEHADRWAEVARFAGRALVGARYRRPLDWVPLADAGGASEVIVGEEFVSAEDGTGIVHMAPAFGADDYAAGQRHGLAFVQPVDGRGRFPEEMPVVGGLFVKAADPEIIEELKRRGVHWKSSTIEHAYPHCWRCGTPLLYYARTSWFVRTTAFADRMMARNARVEWHPEEVGSGRFGEWLRNNIDWAVSRDRFWGTPLPVWVNDEDPDEIEVIGSYAALAERIGRALPDDFDPHKPFIDEYAWPARSGRGTMRRVPQVIDTWFDSGSMPFAQWHYPFEHRETVARQYPADFIAEGVDQTRGWFYSLLAIATGLEDALPNNGDGAGAPPAPYGSVVVNDLVLDAEGVKMSKSRGNIVDPWEVFERHGVDAVRLFLVASSQIWVPRRFDEQAIRETAGRFLLTLKNSYSGIFALYANFGYAPSAEDRAPADRPLLDRWILSRLYELERAVDADLAAFEATAAARRLIDFVTDDLSNWYIRLNRPRFYDVEGDDNRAAFATLHEALTVTCRLLAPLAPFISDWIHRELTGESVHLAPFVREKPPAVGPDGTLSDETLVRGMAAIRTLATLGRAAREEAGIRVRQPLGRIVCVAPASDGDLQPLLPLLEAELNVKRSELATSADALVTLHAKANYRSLGKKFGKGTPLAAKAVEALASDSLRAFERGEPLAISVGNESRELDAEDLVILRRAAGALVVQESGGYFAAVDPEITPALRREGIVRELVSRVQRMRKEAGLAVSDRIALVIAGNEEVEAAVEGFRDRIASDVLARELTVGGAASSDIVMREMDLDGSMVRIGLKRVT